MKKLALFILLLSVLSACTKDDNETTTTSDYHGKWTLVRISGTRENSVTTGNDMAWQEYYVFNNDGTFTKSRTQNAVTTTVSGTYTTQNNTEVFYLELKYTQDKGITGSCFGNLKETLFFSAKNTLSSNWSACDGPGLDYQKLNQ